LMVYDLHTLQNRFYLHGNSVASLQTAIPLLKERILRTHERDEHDDGVDEHSGGCDCGPIDCVAFPDDGAAKRFGVYFEDMVLPDRRKVEVVVCGKTRGTGDVRTVTIQEGGDPAGKRVVIVDDLVQTGGTLYETAKILRSSGAISVSAYCTHAVFPHRSYRRFNKGGDRAVFQKFWVTNSIPTVTDELPVDDGVFEVLDLMDLIVHDLDHFGSSPNGSGWSSYGFKRKKR